MQCQLLSNLKIVYIFKAFGVWIYYKIEFRVKGLYFDFNPSCHLSFQNWNKNPWSGMLWELDINDCVLSKWIKLCEWPLLYILCILRLVVFSLRQKNIYKQYYPEVICWLFIILNMWMNN